MINEDKVRIMTKLAIYEEGRGKSLIPVSKYFKEDYVGIQMLKSFFAGTIGFALVMVLVVAYQIEDLINEIVKLDIVAMIAGALGAYVVFMAVYLGLTYFLCTIHYKKAKKSLKAYDSVLKKLEGIYEKEETDTKPMKW